MITLRLDKNGGINKGDIKAFEHDNLSEVYIIQLYKNGEIYDLTNKSIELTMVERKRKIGDMVSLPIYEATEGKVKLEVVSDITKQDGIYDFKLTVKDTTGLIETFPSFQVKIENDITDHITGEIVQDKNFTILTEGLKALADYNIYKTNALKVPEIEQDIVEINEQLDTKVNVYNTVNDMKNDSNIKKGVRCKTLGFREVGDGGGGYYIVTEDTPNGCNILKINDLLSAKLIIEYVVNFKQVGGNGWGQNDLLSNYFTTLEEAKLTYPKATSLNMTINDVLFNVVLENFKDLYIPEGVYYFNYNVSIPDNKNVYGAGTKQTFLKQNSTMQFITLDGSYIKLSDFIVVSNSSNKADFGIVINKNKNFNIINNVIVQYFKTGIRINTNSFLTNLNEVSIFNCDNYGLDVADENNVLNIDKCKINYCDVGIQCVSARNINITKSWIELCNIGVLKKDKGNLNITDTYFERNTDTCIKIAWGTSPCELIKVTGCSFFTDISNSIINYHGLATTKMVVENSYFTEYDINSSITSKIFEKGNVDTTMKPIFKNCFLNGGITMGITESDYTS